MSLKEVFSEMLQIETKKTRKILERLPEDKLDWKPHEKSFALGGLITHLVNIPNWMAETLEKTAFIVDPHYREEPVRSREDAIQRFAQGVERASHALQRAAESEMKSPWTLKVGEKEIFTLPRDMVLREMIFHHLIHHRAQLTVYLRLLEVPVPALYGPTADEEG